VKVLLVVVLLSAPGAFAQNRRVNEPVNADGLDRHSEKALMETQELLRNKQKRDEAIDANDKSRAADAYVDKIGADREKIYDLTADILATIVKRTKGDVKAMEKMMEEAAKNPEAFANSLTGEQKRGISEIAAPMSPPVNQK